MINYLILLMSTILISACGPNLQVQRVPIKENSVKSITFLEPGPAKSLTINIPGAGTGFGVIGALAYLPELKEDNKKIDNLSSKFNFNPGKEFSDLLKSKLASSNFSVEAILVERNKVPGLFKSYDFLGEVNSDAILDISIDKIGWETGMNIHSSLDWRPSTVVQAALIDSKTKEILYSERFMYGNHHPLINAKKIDAPKEYYIKSTGGSGYDDLEEEAYDPKKELLSDEARLIQGMRLSINSIIEQLSADLMKKNL